MTSAETALYESETVTAELVRDACLAVHALETEERYVRLLKLSRWIRPVAPQFSKAVLGFQSFGPAAISFRELAC